MKNNSISGLVAVPYDGSPRQFTFGIVGLTADLLQALGTSTSSCKFPSTQQLQGLQAQVSGSFPDPIYGLAVNFTISYDPSPPPNGPVTFYNPVCTVIAGGAVLAVALGTIEAYQPGCTPSISSIQVNGQTTSHIIAGTNGSLNINGTCLSSVSQGQSDTSGLSITLQANGNSDKTLKATYTATACQDGQGTCTAGPHTLTVLGNAGQADYPLDIDAMTSLHVSQPPTANPAPGGTAPPVTPLTCINTSPAFAVLVSTVAALPNCNGFVVVLMNSGTVTVDGTNSFLPVAAANLVRWRMDRDPTDAVGTGVPFSGGSGTVVTFEPSMPGNFRLVAYIDLNSNGTFDIGEQLQVLQIAIVQATMQPGSQFLISGSVLANGPSGAKTNPTGFLATAPMQLSANYLLQGGGTTQLVGTAAISIGNIGNLLSDTFTVFYPGTIPVGTETESPGGALPMVDTLSVSINQQQMSGGDAAFRVNSGTSTNPGGPPPAGILLRLTSGDAPRFAWNLTHPTTHQDWGSSLGGISFTEFVAAYSSSFPFTYVALNQARWQVTVVGTNDGGWEDQGTSSISGDATLQAVSSSMQAWGYSYGRQNSMVPQP